VRSEAVTAGDATAMGWGKSSFRLALQLEAAMICPVVSPFQHDEGRF
jgi:hypothetical protein